MIVKIDKCLNIELEDVTDVEAETLMKNIGNTWMVPCKITKCSKKNNKPFYQIEPWWPQAQFPSPHSNILLDKINTWYKEL